jgi:hypothetical protein
MAPDGTSIQAGFDVPIGEDAVAKNSLDPTSSLHLLIAR